MNSRRFMYSLLQIQQIIIDFGRISKNIKNKVKYIKIYHVIISKKFIDF